MRNGIQAVVDQGNITGRGIDTPLKQTPARRSYCAIDGLQQCAVTTAVHTGGDFKVSSGGSVDLNQAPFVLPNGPLQQGHVPFLRNVEIINDGAKCTKLSAIEGAERVQRCDAKCLH